MNTKFTFSQFLIRFPNDDSCLEEIKQLRYPEGSLCSKCHKKTNFYKVKGRTAYACQFCGAHIYPLAKTIFDKTSTPLRLWFYAMYLMVQTRAGISAKQLQRELGVTYKTAWRMFKQIRALMADTSGTPLTGTVEVDETFIGGKGKNRAYEHRLNLENEDKEILMGMVERGGKVYLKHIPNTGKWTLLDQIKANVDPKAKIYTDQYGGYTHLSRLGYEHDYVLHRDMQFTKGIVHTQNIESFWSGLKRGITGVYRVVSKKYLQAYADEYAWRYNNRKFEGKMFNRLLEQVPEVRVLPATKLA
ncbi:IS1595 family transposase [Patescibacteria group bacterium]|nr:IS1595 family transposase [Patescibacteria group bacterium]